MSYNPLLSSAPAWTSIAARPLHTADVSADRAFASTTLANVTDLALSVALNTTYWIKGMVLYQSTDTAVGPVIAVTWPGTGGFIGVLPGVGLTNITASGGSMTATSVPVANTTYLAILEGMIRTGGASGTVQIRAARHTDVGNATVTIIAHSAVFSVIAT